MILRVVGRKICPTARPEGTTGKSMLLSHFFSKPPLFFETFLPGQKILQDEQVVYAEVTWLQTNLIANSYESAPKWFLLS